MKRLTVPAGMPDAGHSAWRVALRRAAHQLFDEPVVFRDAFAVRLLGEAGAEALRRTPAAQKRVWSRSLRAFVVARSAFAESCVAGAYGEGVRQYCLLGAGLDTFALRNPWAGLRVFELDQAAVQAWKQELAARAGLSFAGRCEWIAGDLGELRERGDLADLADRARRRDRADWRGRADWAGQRERAGQTEFTVRADRVDHRDWRHQTEQSERCDQTDHAERIGLSGAADMTAVPAATGAIGVVGATDAVGAAELRAMEQDLDGTGEGKRGGGAWPPGTMDPGQPAVFAMLGVAPFVGPATLRAVLDRVQGFARGSAIVFDYRLPRAALEEEERRQYDSLQKRATAKGEPFAEGWTPGAMAQALRGFARVEDLGGAELNARYFEGRQDGLRVRGGAARVVLAVV